MLMMGHAHVWIGLLFFKRLSLHLPTLPQWSSDGGWEYYGVSIPQKWNLKLRYRTFHMRCE